MASKEGLYLHVITYFVNFECYLSKLMIASIYLLFWMVRNGGEGESIGEMYLELVDKCPKRNIVIKNK